MAERKTTPNIMGELLGGKSGTCSKARQAPEATRQYISKTVYWYTSTTAHRRSETNQGYVLFFSRNYRGDR